MADAPAKTILFGEHAVVYGKPGIAIPVHALRTASTFSRDDSGSFRVQSPKINLDARFEELESDHPLRLLLLILMDRFGLQNLPSGILKIESNIPLAAGLGSGASSSVAIIRTLAAAVDQMLSDREVSEIAFEIEKLYHGDPSGLDNTVITYAKPVFYIKGKSLEILDLPEELPLLIVNSGEQSRTVEVVADVRRNAAKLAPTIEAIGSLVEQSRIALASGDLPQIGSLMNRNQLLLRICHGTRRAGCKTDRRWPRRECDHSGGKPKGNDSAAR
jgi:mevalonate kinase